MNILLIGEDAAGIRTLQALRRSQHRIVAVMARPPREGRGGETLWKLAGRLGYATWPAQLVRDPNFAEQIRKHEIDITLNVHSLYLICEEVLMAPRLGSYNLHPGPLPRYAGLNSVCWAIYNGEQKHGVTLHRMVPEIDAGAIAYQEWVDIESGDTGLSLTTKCVDAGIPLVLRLLEAAALDESSIPSVQQDLSKREYFGGQVPDNGILHWDRPAGRVVDFIRACDFFPFRSPWGHPRTTRGDGDIQIARARLTGIPTSMPPGTVGESSDWGVEVACADEWILVEAVHVDGTNVPATDVLRHGDHLLEPAQPPPPQASASTEPARQVSSASALISERVLNDPTPLTFTQEEMWRQCQSHPEASLFNEPVTLRHVGDLDAAALERSFNEIVRLDEAWRTSISVVRGKPMQVVHPDLRLSLSVVDLRHLSGSDREVEASRIARSDAGEPLDLTRAPAFRVKLIRLGDREHCLCLTVSQILLDRASIEIFAHRLTSFYRELVAGRASPAFESGIQQADVARRERRPETRKELARQLTYWQCLLLDHNPTLEWPNDHPRPPIQSHRGAMRAIEFPEGEYRAIEALCEREGVSPFMALTAGFASVLHRYTGAPIVVLGTYVPGRRRREDLEASGCFEHLLPIRVDVSGNPTFQELLSRIRIAIGEAESNSDVPFGHLVEHLHVIPDPSRHPLFQVTLTLRPPAPALDKEWTIRHFDVPTGAARCDLAIDVRVCPNGIAGWVTYCSDLLEDDTVARAVEHWRTLVAGAAADVSRRLSDLPLLTEHERELIVRRWNSTEQAYPPVTIHQLFEDQARRTPDAVAVEMGRDRLTYRELNRRANQVARYLRRLGVGERTLVGLFVERSPELVVALLGILKAGAAYIPLDPLFPKQRLELMLLDSRPPVVIAHEALRGALPRLDAELVLIDADWTSIGEESGDEPHGVSRPEDLAYILYTSGSTGRPKGVQIEHRSVVNFLLSMRREPGLRGDDVLLAVTTMSFDIAGLEMFLPLITGARLAIASSAEARDGALLVDLLDRSRATVMQATPSTWRMLIASGWEGGPEFKILCGGEPMPPELARELAKRSGSVWNLYGPTETTIWSTVGRVVNASEGQISIGRPIANTQIYLLDASHNPVPVGITGDLYIGGDGVARGYFNRPELTAERFVPDVFALKPDARMYKTGDLARYRRDGSIEFLGRSDFQVKVRGFRIELGDIESALMEHPDVTEAVVVVREEDPGGPRLVAYAIPGKGRVPAVGDLREFLARKLPRYMVPGQFVVIDRFPLTPNGKVDRRALPAPAPDASANDEYVAPRNQIEADLVTIWEDVLGTRPIGVTSNFFDLGGHSLLVTNLVLQIEEKFGKRLTVASIFEAETVERLAALLAHAGPHGSSSDVVPIQKSGSNAPFFCLGAGPMFRPLARLFGPEQPFLGVRAEPHELAAIAPPDDFEEIARVFAKKIRSYQPQGPYYIGGFCLTGVVAYEVCRQLIAQGQEIGRLVVFYGNTPGFFASSSRLFRYRLRLHSLVHHLKILSGLRGVERRKYLLDRIEGVKEKLFPPAVHNAASALPELEYIGAVAARGYRPQPAPIPMVVFRPLEDPQGRFWDVQADWGKYTTARLDVHSTPGDHSTMFREPNVGALAKKVKPYLASETELGHASPDEHYARAM